MINFPSVIENKIESISEITFDSVENETLKKDLIAIALDGSTSSQSLNSKLQKHEILVKEIFLNNNIKIILNKKKDDEVSEILLEIMDEIKEIKQNKKIESLESRLINNLDEQSYLELIKLKSQLNRE